MIIIIYFIVLTSCKDTLIVILNNLISIIISITCIIVYSFFIIDLEANNSEANCTGQQ